MEDSVQLFTSDTLKGGAKKPELVKAGLGSFQRYWVVVRLCPRPARRFCPRAPRVVSARGLCGSPATEEGERQRLEALRVTYPR